MRRVLSLSTLYPNAARPTFGAFVARSLEALAARGDWQVTVINAIGLPPLAPGRYAEVAKAASDGPENGVEVFRPRFPIVPAVGARWNAALLARSVLPLAQRLHAEKPFALVDAQFFWPDGPAAATVARALGLPLSIKARGADIHFWGSRPFARKLMLAAGHQAAGLLAVSEALKGDMVSLGLPASKIAIHYTGLDRARFVPRPRDEARAELAGWAASPVPAQGRLLAAVGALIPRKGQEIGIRALALLPPDLRLALAGTGPDETNLRCLAEKLGLSERVHFLGTLQHDRLPVLLSAADAMVLPAASEGLANAWVEALACGTPIVIAEAGGAHEVVTDEVAGRIASRTPEGIAVAVAEVLAAPSSQADVAARAERFSWEANAAALAAHYEALLA